MSIDLLYVFAGLSIGFLVGLTGIGGGALMTPVLILFFAVPLPVAISTDLLFAAITKCSGVFTYARQRMVDWKVAFLMLSGSVPGSVLALYWIKQYESLSEIEGAINLVLGISLITTATAVFFRSKLQQLGSRNQEAKPDVDQSSIRSSATVIIGFFLGGMVTISSVGAGALGTALLIVLYPRMRMSMVVGTDLFHAVVLTSVAGFGHFTMGSIDFALLAYLVMGSLPGVMLGSHFGVKLSPQIMQPVMGCVLLVVGSYFIFVS